MSATASMSSRVTCSALIRNMLKDTHAKSTTRGDWADRHVNAWGAAFDPGCSIVKMIEALAAYADSHHARFESSIGDDGVLGGCWLDMMRGARGLLDGETGSLDCGTVDALLWAMVQNEGLSFEA